MSKEKQIEEMAKISCNTNNTEIKWECAECPFNMVCDIQISCEALYNAGYRKQSEVVRCKDCEHFYQDGTLKVCRHWNCHSTEDDAYCSFAKMKGGAE